MIAVIIIFSVLMFALLGIYASYDKTFYNPPRDPSKPEKLTPVGNHPFREETRKMAERINSLPCEFVTTVSHDGLKLSARYYRGNEDMPLCICFHGYRGAAMRDFSGGGLLLIDEGYNVLIVDQRAHGRSDGTNITFGVNERYDVLTWIKYTNERFGADKPTYLFGISMGASTVIMASGLDLPDNIRAVAADCPYSSPKKIIKHVCRRIRLNPELSWPIVWLASRIYAHFDVNAITAAEAVKKTKIPILIIHGEGDRFVPPEMSEEIALANPDMVERHTFADAGHGLSYFYDTERYKSIVKDFLKKHP